MELLKKLVNDLDAYRKDKQHRLVFERSLVAEITDGGDLYMHKNNFDYSMRLTPTEMEALRNFLNGLK